MFPGLCLMVGRIIRSYHYIVSCGENGVYVWKFKLIYELFNKDQNFDNVDKVLVPKSIRVENIDCKVLSLNTIPVRATWNYMATVIAVSCGNKNIALFKKKTNGDWDLITVIKNN